MESHHKDQQRLQFGKGVLFVGGLFIALFTAEFLVEWTRLGMPDVGKMSWQGVNNAKLVDSLSPIARAYNNVLAMLIATVGLAIPLTANMHTPKLIDLFLEDWVNRVVLVVMAIGAANVLFVIYIIGPEFAPMWAFRAAIYGSLVGWAVLIPYFFYVVRFLDPSTIVVRLKADALAIVREATQGKCDMEKAQAEVQERLFQIGTLVIKSIDRADRSVAREGIWALKQIVDLYGEHKADLPDSWFKVDRGDFPGMSSQAIEQINRKHTWMEMHVLYQLLLCYQHALAKAPDAVSAISNVNRIVATKAAARKDGSVVSLCIRYFNTFLREALNRREARAAYDIFYQYRQLAATLSSNPKHVRRIGRFFVTYANLAEQMGIPFVSNLAGYDLVHVMEQAYLAQGGAADDLLKQLLGMPSLRDGKPHAARVQAKLIAAGFFAEHELAEPLERVRADLLAVPPEAVRAACEHLMHIGKQQFWEITDRAVNIEWTPTERRQHIQTFVAELGEPAGGQPDGCSSTPAPSG